MWYALSLCAKVYKLMYVHRLLTLVLVKAFANGMNGLCFNSNMSMKCIFLCVTNYIVSHLFVI